MWNAPMSVSSSDAAAAGSRRSAETALPSRFSTALYNFKVAVFRIRRAFIDRSGGPRRLKKAATGLPEILAQSWTPLWSDSRPAERIMQLGKVHNLRVAARLLDGTQIAPGETFSFWKQLGRPSRANGFVAGRMLQQGCMVPATGGGLCQLSNALYGVALEAGCEIVERHAHSRTVPGSLAERGRDATVAWNYVDLRFRAKQRVRLRVQVTSDELVVGLHGEHAQSASHARDTISVSATAAASGETCGTCAETSCFRHEPGKTLTPGRTAFLVDEAWPEFTEFVAREKQTGDALGIPMDGARWGMQRYRWNTIGFGEVKTAGSIVLRRGLATRRLAQQGAARQTAQLQAAEAMAAHLARLLKPDVTNVTVAQSLLPFLWRDGHLGGRRFRVLMTRLPMLELQRRLDAAALLHPERVTLADFRAAPEIGDWETKALAAADSIVSPHEEIVRLFGTRAIKLDWRVPARQSDGQSRLPSRRIAFPGPTVARKGAYELREAARKLDIEIVPLGNDLEGGSFWEGLRIGGAEPNDWLADIAVVVQPSLIEERPQRLLAALARGVPVIATAACGLDAQDGLTIVPARDAEALVDAINAVLK
jgi:hypothetical protein